MKHFFLTLLLAALCATGHGQTIKSLGYNTNGNVVYTGTNVLTFTNNIGFSSGRIEIGQGLGFWDEADGTYALFFQGDDPVILNSRWNDDSVRSALGLGATWLTNTNVTNFRAAIGLGATNEVQFAHIDTTSFEILGSNGVVFDLPIAADATRANLSLPLPALTNTSNVTMMRALAGSTNTNQPFSGTFQFISVGDDVFEMVVSNGIILSVSEP